MINSNVAAQDTLRATSTGQTSDVNHLAHSVSDGLTENKKLSLGEPDFEACEK